MIDINKFLQLDNPDIARQTRNMSYFDALKSEIPGTKSYQGYNPFYKGADKTGLGGYLKQGVDSVQGKFTPGSNVGGATPLTRKLAQDTMRLGIGASQAGKSILGRVLATALGPAATYASALTAPNVIMASMLDGPNVRSGAADEYVGLMGEAMPEEDYAGLADLLGVPEASQALDDEYYDFDKAPYSELDDFEAQNAGQFVPEEEKGLGELLRNLSGGAVNFGKDILGRQIASQALGRAGAMINPYLALAGGITGLLGGGDLFNSNSLSQRNFDNLSPEAQAYTSSLYGRQRDGTPGLLEGYNQISARGVGALGTLQNRLSNIQNRKAPQTPYSINLSNQIQNAIDTIIADKDKKAGMNAPNNIGLGGGGGGDSDGGYSQSAVDAGIQAAEDDI
jgi:hypothetical protein